MVDRTVQTSYDDDGNLLQQGYTIYQCSICGEQYKDIQGTGSPGGTEDDKSLWEQLGDLIGSGIVGSYRRYNGKKVCVPAIRKWLRNESR